MFVHLPVQVDQQGAGRGERLEPLNYAFIVTLGRIGQGIHADDLAAVGDGDRQQAGQAGVSGRQVTAPRINHDVVADNGFTLGENASEHAVCVAEHQVAFHQLAHQVARLVAPGQIGDGVDFQGGLIGVVLDDFADQGVFAAGQVAQCLLQEHPERVARNHGVVVGQAAMQKLKQLAFLSLTFTGSADVAQVGQNADELALVMVIGTGAQGHFTDGQMYRDGVAIPVLGIDFTPGADDFGMAGALVGGQVAVVVFGPTFGHQHFYVLPDQLVLAVAQHGADKAVDLDDAAFAINAHNAGRSAFDDGLVACADDVGPGNFIFQCPGLVVHLDELFDLSGQQFEMLLLCG